MAQANWTKKVDWSLTSLLCCFSGVLGVALGMGVMVWGELTTVTTVTEPTVAKTSIKQDKIALQSFFPELKAVEETIERVQIRETIRRESARQQQLEQTRESLAFNGATAEDIEAHVIRQLTVTTNPTQNSLPKP